MPLVVPPSQEVLPRPAGLARQLEKSWRHTHNTWVRPWRKRCAVLARRDEKLLLRQLVRELALWRDHVCRSPGTFCPPACSYRGTK